MSGFDEPWKQSWAREADKVKALTESLRYTVKERDTWRQRAERAETERDQAITAHVKITTAMRCGGRVPENAIDTMKRLRERLGK